MKGRLLRLLSADKNCPVISIVIAVLPVSGDVDDYHSLSCYFCCKSGNIYMLLCKPGIIIRVGLPTLLFLVYTYGNE